MQHIIAMDCLLSHPEEDDYFFDLANARLSSPATENSPADGVASCDLGIATELSPIFPDSPSESRLEEHLAIEVLPASVLPLSVDASILFASDIAKSPQRGSADHDRPTYESAVVELGQDGARADCLESNTVTSTTVPGLSPCETFVQATDNSIDESVKESSPYSGLVCGSHGNSAPLHSPGQPGLGKSVNLDSEVVSSIQRAADGSPEGTTDEVISGAVNHTPPDPRDGEHAEPILTVSTMSSLDVEGAGVGIAELWDPEMRFQRPNNDGKEATTLHMDDAGKGAAQDQAKPVAQNASTDVTHTGNWKKNKTFLLREKAVNVTEINSQRLLSERPSAGCCVMTAIKISEDSNSNDPYLSTAGDNTVPSYQMAAKTSKKRKCHKNPEINQSE